ncbi:MAG: hypothetical protein MI921_05555 [Cytophagales bacterium]|nr:hypothetical protein [Cytophagales bacterium]
MRNELVEFPNISDFPVFDNRYAVGESRFGRKQFTPVGVNPETGIYEFADVNNDGSISDFDRQEFVETRQDYFGGVNNSFSWKSLKLDIQIQFVKQKSFDLLLTSLPGTQANTFTSVLDRWQAPGDISKNQRFTNSNSTARTAYFRYWRSVNSSFVRLQNVAFSWALPQKWCQKVKVDNANIYVQGQNLFTITEYEGIDPETGAFGLPPLRLSTLFFYT